MFFKQFYDQHLSQSSYLIGCQRTGEAIVIDPKRDVRPYIEVAEAEGLRITHAAETHIHADYASGIRDIAEQLHATIYVSGEGDESLGYRNMPEQTIFVYDKDEIYVGNVKLEVLHTPGHTPESISFLLTDIGGGSSVPMGLFSGDFLFVGDVGRPDLLEKAVQISGSTEVGAKQMYQSLEKITSLPDYIQIWPGHGAGSPCGKSLGAVPMSTLGYEKANNWAFQAMDEATFVEELTTNQPAPPHHFAQMKKINQYGNQPFSPYVVYPSQDVSLQTFDVRTRSAYHGGHQKGAINIPFDKNFINQVGWYLDYDQPINIVGDDKTVQDVAYVLQLIGYDLVHGYVAPGDEVVTQHVHSEDITGNEKNVLDVRNDEEWDGGHLQQAVHIPHGKLLEQDIPFEKNEPLYVHCQSGVRSSIAVGILEQKGFTNVINIKEGYKDIRSNI
ncbi:hydroxyacylglutathione hydrolase [Paraliobacillus ryukyuensis]|uniref:Glyoxylase-like metal-dependent hydrolase (Beta-lactamase superfamily II) n=1 Tax=Paraliobacillus ryukyuensis TaxID=200904 RepID=A0A366DZ81_9BACI|nr:persulfide dioxygenase-sulfurtransferase CstB [Paraliobacillus ryukyuensis]RBO95410.1 glyoxylase-like metal-dependent hydrolase (beta-lactamase superfamily II) [Paraliobacillus ryukyuensis]